MAFLQGIASLKKAYLLKIQNLVLGISFIQSELTYLFFTVTLIKITISLIDATVDDPPDILRITIHATPCS